MHGIRGKKMLVGRNPLGLICKGVRRAILAQRKGFFYLSRTFIMEAGVGGVMHDSA